MSINNHHHTHSYEPVTTSIENGHIAPITKDKEKHKQDEEEVYEEELLSTWDLIKLCIPVIPSQLGWAVGEALLIPYLISLGVEETLANAIWLVNPLVGFFLQPLIGSFSDHCHSRWGRRRPFLLLFHLGIMIGLLTICFCNEILAFITTRPALTPDNHATTELLIIIFTGCVIMELSNDLLTIPSRALLNDQLPEKQLEQGNAMFAMMNSAGAVVGLTMCLVPLQKTWPFSLLETQLRATFMMSVILIMTSNFFTMSIPEWMDDETETDDSVEEDQHLLTNELSTRSAPLYGEGHDEEEGGEEGEGEGEDEEEQVADPEHMGIYKSLTAFRLLPKELIAIWVVQFAWWLTVMQISFWWTTWIGIEVFHADAILSHDLFYDGVQYGIIQLLIHSIVSFFASHALTWTNNTFGVTRVYHASAVLFAASCCALWWWRTRTASMIFMVFTGILYPVINTNPFILIEVYTTYDEEEGEGEGEEGEGEETTTTEAVPTGQAVVIPAAVSTQDTSTTSSIDPVVPSTILIIPEPSPPEHDTPIDIDTDDIHTPHTHTRRYRSTLGVLTESEASDRDSGTSSEDEIVTEPESPIPPLIPVTPTTTVKATPTPIGIPLEATPNVTPTSPSHHNIEASPSGYSPDRRPMRSQSDMDGASSDSDTSLDLSDTSPLVLGRPASHASLSRLTLQSTSLPDNNHTSHDVLHQLQSHASPDITIQYHDTDTVDVGISHHMYRHRSDSEIYHPAVQFRGRTRSMDGMSESDSEGFSTTTGTGTGTGSDSESSSPEASPRSDTGDDQSPRESRSLLSSTSTSSSTPTTTSTTISTTSTSTSTPILTTLTDHHLYNSEHEDEKNHMELISPRSNRVTFPHSSAMSTTTSVDESQGMEEEDESEEYLDANLHRGVLTAIMNLSMGLSQVISATLGGIIIKYVGDITIVFLLSGVLSIVVNIVVVMMGWSSRDETAEEEEEEAAEVEAETEAVNERKITPVIVPIASLTAEQQLAVAATSTEASISVQNAINEEAAATEAKEEKEKWDAMEVARQTEREERRRMIQARKIAKEKARREKWKKEREALLQHLRDQPSQPQPVPQSAEKKEADTLLSTSLPEYGSFDIPHRKHRRKHRKRDEHVIDIVGYEREREKEKKHRKRHRPRHHHLNMAADISSRRGLSGRYAVGDEADIERERLHLLAPKQRKTPALGPISHTSQTTTTTTTTTTHTSKDTVISSQQRERRHLRQKRSKDLRRKLQRSASTAQHLLSKTP